MDELQELRASVTAAAWSQQAAALLAAVAAVKAAATSPAPQQAQQQPQQQPHERQAAVSTDGQRPDAAIANGSSHLDAAAAQQQAVAADGAAAAAEQQQQPQQPGTSEQVSLWQRIAAAEAAAAAAAEGAEAQLPAVVEVDAVQADAAAPGMGTFSQLLHQGSPEAAGQPSQHSMDGGAVAMTPAAASAAAEVTRVCVATCIELQMRLAASWLSILC